MIRKQLEQEFTSMLVRTGNSLAYGRLALNYFKFDKDYAPLTEEQSLVKVEELRNGDPREWITKIFTEGLDIPPKLYQVNVLWLQHLEESEL